MEELSTTGPTKTLPQPRTGRTLGRSQSRAASFCSRPDPAAARRSPAFARRRASPSGSPRPSFARLAGKTDPQRFQTGAAVSPLATRRCVATRGSRLAFVLARASGPRRRGWLCPADPGIEPASAVPLVQHDGNAGVPRAGGDVRVGRCIDMHSGGLAPRERPATGDAEDGPDERLVATPIIRTICGRLAGAIVGTRATLSPRLGSTSGRIELVTDARAVSDGGEQELVRSGSPGRRPRGGIG
jgi:hypothetical protein